MLKQQLGGTPSRPGFATNLQGKLGVFLPGLLVYKGTFLASVIHTCSQEENRGYIEVNLTILCFFPSIFTCCDHLDGRSNTLVLFFIFGSDAREWGDEKLGICLCRVERSVWT